jgi:hypothetical protein
MKIKYAGFYDELEYINRQCGSIYEVIAKSSNQDKDKIIPYLESGEVLWACPTVTRDVLLKVEKFIGPLNILTDGIWTWPSDLVYYLKEYHVALDKDFISHMRNNNWVFDKNAVNFEELEELWELEKSRRQNGGQSPNKSRNVMKLRRVGFYKELDYGDEDGESLYKAISITPDIAEDRIIRYLESGKLLSIIVGFTRDVLSKNEKIIGSLSTFTDGVWIWSSDLSYYVREYHIALDKEFILHMKNSGWTVNEYAIEKYFASLTN